MNIFIHSLFRTGSTYVYSKFRQNDGCCCYYEPLHEALIDLRKYLKNDQGIPLTAMRHPPLDQSYFHEYEKLLDSDTSSVPYFKKSFTADEFCHTGDNPRLKQYIDFLIQNAANKTPVFQFNRTALRVKWFKTNYPDALNIYIVRNPRDSWASHLSILQGGNSYFVAFCLLFASLNKDTQQFSPLPDYIPLIDYHSPIFSDQILFYAQILDAYAENEKYFIFYLIWLTALIENVIHSDIIINMNQLTNSDVYRSTLAGVLEEKGVDRIDFSDANIPVYPDQIRSPEEMADIEHQVQQLVFQSLGKEKTKAFFDAIQDEAQSYFNLRFENLFADKNTGIPPLKTDKVIDKYIRIVQALADKNMDLFNESETARARHEQYINDLRETITKKDKYTALLEQGMKKLQTDAEAQINDLKSSLEVSTTYARSMKEELDKIRNSNLYKIMIKPWIK